MDGRHPQQHTLHPFTHHTHGRVHLPPQGKQIPVGAYVKSFGAPQKQGASVTGLSARFEADVGVTAGHSSGAPFRRSSIISAELVKYMDIELGQLKELPPSEVSKHQVAALTPSWASWENRGGS
jgi:hypothetical protein